MAEINRFIPRNDRDYPKEARFSLVTEDIVPLASLPVESLPADADHIAITLWLGNNTTTRFYEELKPQNAPIGPIITLDEYLTLQEESGVPPVAGGFIERVAPDRYTEILEQHSLPLPPEGWTTGEVIFTKISQTKTTVQFPTSPDDMQGRFINIAQERIPLRESGIVYQVRENARGYATALEEAGFPSPALKTLKMPKIFDPFERFSRVVRDMTRGMGFNQPPSDGQLIVAVRTENTRPDVRRRH